jgi:ATP-dependent DNA helicase RecQ
VDSRHLLIDMKRIGILRSRHEARTMAMVRFLENEDECRERLLLEYFGERPSGDCGHCDICRRNSTSAATPRKMKDTVIGIIKQKGALSADELITLCADFKKEDVLDLVRTLADDEVVFLHRDFISYTAGR